MPVHGWDDTVGAHRGGRHHRHRRQQQQPDSGSGGDNYGQSDDSGPDTVGLGWSTLTHALNPINQAKALYNVAKNPLHPIDNIRRLTPGLAAPSSGPARPTGSQTAAMRNMFRGNSAQQYAPSNVYNPQYIPPGGYTPQYLQSGGYNQQYVPQYNYGTGVNLSSYDPNAYVAPTADWGEQPTGWDAAYGGGGSDDGTFDAAVDAGY
jgi:hypothetical protein